jgi:hypothetical protein
MFPSSKKKRLCWVNGPSWVDSDVFVSVDSSGNSNDWEDMLPPRISLDRPEGAVLMVSEEEETMVDVDGDSGMGIDNARASGCWSVSGLGCTYGVILLVL